jgi:hypothetical protein
MMTTKERLLLEVQRLTESQAAAVLEFLQSQAPGETSPPPWPPRFAATGHSGRPADLGNDVQIVITPAGTSSERGHVRVTAPHGDDTATSRRHHPSLDDLAGSVPVPPDVLALSWQEIRERAWTGDHPKYS